MCTFSMQTEKRSSGFAPAVELAANYGLKAKQLTEVERLIEEHVNEIRDAWARHFPS